MFKTTHLHTSELRARAMCFLARRACSHSTNKGVGKRRAPRHTLMSCRPIRAFLCVCWCGGFGEEMSLCVKARRNGTGHSGNAFHFHFNRSPTETRFTCKVLLRLAHSVALVCVWVVSCLPADTDSGVSSTPRLAATREREKRGKRLCLN